MQQRRPVMLVILDGWGWRDDPADNAIRQAKTPTFDRLWQTGPHGLLHTCGKDVGLPDGQMGNSEVGHLNIGAGRVVMQDLPRIGAAIASGEIARAPALIDLIAKLKASGGTCHLLGLVSPGGVHSHQDHAAALAKILDQAGVPVAGPCASPTAAIRRRNPPPMTSSGCSRRCPKSVAIATVCGRYFAMDRDKRWDRVEKAYNAIVEADGPRSRMRRPSSPTPTPTRNRRVHRARRGRRLSRHEGRRRRAVLQFPRRPRARNSRRMLDPDFSGFARKRACSFAAAVGMTQYSDALDN